MLSQAGASDRGRDFSARYADAIFAAAPDDGNGSAGCPRTTVAKVHSEPLGIYSKKVTPSTTSRTAP